MNVETCVCWTIKNPKVYPDPNHALFIIVSTKTQNTIPIFFENYFSFFAFFDIFFKIIHFINISKKGCKDEKVFQLLQTSNKI